MSGAFWGRVSDPPATFVLAGGRVIDPSKGNDTVRDVAVVGGVIVGDARVHGAERIDAAGLVIAPGFVDLHAHLREPGTEGETIESGTRAAARGGFTTICAMPNTDPALDDASGVAWLAEGAAQAACRVRAVGAVTAGRTGDRIASVAGLAGAGVVAASDDGATVPTALAREAMAALAQAGLPLVEHAEDPSLAAGGVMRAGRSAIRLGLRAWPPHAEFAIVERDIALVAETGARLHLTHISTRASVDAVRDAKRRGLPVTADVTPHHLAMTDRWVAGSRRFAWAVDHAEVAATEDAYDGSCRVNPPLGSVADAEALMEGLRDGTIDAIATDHAPHPPERKLVPFGEAAPGMVGLETALSVGLAAVEAGRIEMTTLIAALTTRPAAVIGERRGLEPGARADLVAFDPRARWRVERSTLVGRSTNTPLIGFELPGVVRLTVAGGRVTYRS